MLSIQSLPGEEEEEEGLPAVGRKGMRPGLVWKQAGVEGE
jgi:hypothetical protein